MKIYDFHFWSKIYGTVVFLISFEDFMIVSEIRIVIKVKIDFDPMIWVENSIKYYKSHFSKMYKDTYRRREERSKFATHTHTHMRR